MENLYNILFSYNSKEKKACFWDFANSYKYAQELIPDLGDLLLYKNIKELLRSAKLEDRVYYLEINREDSGCILAFSDFDKFGISENIKENIKESKNLSVIFIDEDKVFFSGKVDGGVFSLMKSVFLDMDFQVCEGEGNPDSTIAAISENGKLYFSQSPESSLAYESVKTILLEPQLEYLGKVYKIRV